MLYTLIPDSDHYRGATINSEAVAAVVGGLRDGRLHDRIDANHEPRRWSGVFSEPIKIDFPIFQGSEEKMPFPDIAMFEGRLFLNSKAYEVLGPLIENDGGVLPAQSEETGEGYLFTPLRVAEDTNAANKTLTTHSEGGDVDHLAFHEEKVKAWTIFRCKLTAYMRLYCHENVKTAIEESNLTGLYITPDLANIFPEERSASEKIN